MFAYVFSFDDSSEYVVVASDIAQAVAKLSHLSLKDCVNVSRLFGTVIQ